MFTLTPMASAVALLEAVEESQLMLVYQGIFPIDGATPTGFEALVRWEHPTEGVLAPAQFLPSDMSNGIGWALTNFVLEEAIRQCASWRADGHDVGVSVNIAPGRLADDLLPTQVALLLDRHGVPAPALTIEITEERCGSDPVGIAAALGSLAGIGVRLSLDDFGTGDSSLHRLRQFPFDEIKIDRCFVTEVTTRATDRNIIDAVVRLAHTLGITVVAEGIEDAASLELLGALGVDRGQGFHLHRPSISAPLPAHSPGAAEQDHGHEHRR